MKIRSKQTFEATQYNKRGDHKLDYVWSVRSPIIGELPGEENRWPATGHLATTDECDPADLRYSVFVSETTECKETAPLQGKDFFYVHLTDWILEVNGVIVDVISNEQYERNYEVIE